MFGRLPAQKAISHMLKTQARRGFRHHFHWAATWINERKNVRLMKMTPFVPASNPFSISNFDVSPVVVVTRPNKSHLKITWLNADFLASNHHDFDRQDP